MYTNAISLLVGLYGERVRSNSVELIETVSYRFECIPKAWKGFKRCLLHLRLRHLCQSVPEFSLRQCHVCLRLVQAVPSLEPMGRWANLPRVQGASRILR